MRSLPLVRVRKSRTAVDDNISVPLRHNAITSSYAAVQGDNILTHRQRNEHVQKTFLLTGNARAQALP